MYQLKINKITVPNAVSTEKGTIEEIFNSNNALLIDLVVQTLKIAVLDEKNIFIEGQDIIELSNNKVNNLIEGLMGILGLYEEEVYYFNHDPNEYSEFGFEEEYDSSWCHELIEKYFKKIVMLIVKSLIRENKSLEDLHSNEYDIKMKVVNAIYDSIEELIEVLENNFTNDFEIFTFSVNLYTL